MATACTSDPTCGGADRPDRAVPSRATPEASLAHLAALESLLAAVPKEAPKEVYRRAIVENNVLGKKTVSTRRASAKRLSELYALDPGMVLFRLLRFFWNLDREGRPLLALLCAAARDPLLRTAAPAVLSVPIGDPVSKKLLQDTLSTGAPGRFNPAMIQKIARYIASSLTQSGHLEGHLTKRQAHPVATAATTAYALVLGYLAGSGGQMLFNTHGTRLLDVPAARLKDLAAEASRRGWIKLRQSGAVVEVRFPLLLTPEEEARRGQD